MCNPVTNWTNDPLAPGLQPAHINAVISSLWIALPSSASFPMASCIFYGIWNCNSVILDLHHPICIPNFLLVKLQVGNKLSASPPVHPINCRAYRRQRNLIPVFWCLKPWETPCFDGNNSSLLFLSCFCSP